LRKLAAEMITDLRERYNAAFTQARYDAFVQDLNSTYRATSSAT
jgi:hypothetical protein